MDKSPVHLPEGYVDFYKSIETWQNQVLFRLKKACPVKKKDALTVLETTGKPILDTVEWEVDPRQYKEAVMELIGLVEEERKASKPKLQKVAQALENCDFSVLAGKIMENDKEYFASLLAPKGVEADLVIFVLDHALRPFLRHFAIAYQDSLMEDEKRTWPFGTCPVCGFMANFSRVRAEDGRRFLFCEHCFTEWEFAYLGCIHCGNTEPNTIRYFVLEGDEANQLFVCDKCRGYLKTFDERKGGVERDLFIAGIETVYLDLLAEREGYTNRVMAERDFN